MDLTIWIILVLNLSVSSAIYDGYHLPISLINLRMFLLCPYLNIKLLCSSRWPVKTQEVPTRQGGDKGWKPCVTAVLLFTLLKKSVSEG